MPAHPDAKIKTGTAITIPWPSHLAPCGGLGPQFFSSARPAPRLCPVQPPRQCDLSGGRAVHWPASGPAPGPSGGPAGSPRPTGIPRRASSSCWPRISWRIATRGGSGRCGNSWPSLTGSAGSQHGKEVVRRPGCSALPSKTCWWRAPWMRAVTRLLKAMQARAQALSLRSWGARRVPRAHGTRGLVRGRGGHNHLSVPERHHGRPPLCARRACGCGSGGDGGRAGPAPASMATTSPPAGAPRSPARVRGVMMPRLTITIPWRCSSTSPAHAWTRPTGAIPPWLRLLRSRPALTETCRSSPSAGPHSRKPSAVKAAAGVAEEQARRQQRPMRVKEPAWQVMEAAYLKASANGRCPRIRARSCTSPAQRLSVDLES